MKNSFKKLIILSLILGLSLFIWHYSRAQVASSSTADSNFTHNSDAIAVRIIPNPNHYSIARWYANQGFQGSPQSLVVDGYNAIRDGRTVYVNAANVDSNKNIYTNIYLISYNQNSSPKTVDILGQIISHWKFNDNLTNNSVQSSCSISNLSCNSDSDCASGQYCKLSGSNAGTCELKTKVDCVVDSDCPTNFFCNSLKAKVIRDVKRMGRLEELKIALNNFKNINGHYPILASGTYLPGNSVSLWPSWSQSLLSDLALAPTITDPINHLGACQGYSQPTCWNVNSKQFFSKANNNATLVLPADSYALAYETNSTGSNYHICATLETKALGYKFAPTDPVSSNCVTAIGVGESGTANNQAPQLQEEFLKGEAHQEFNGFIRVSDANHDPLTWSLKSAPGTNWASWKNNNKFNQVPILKDTSNPYQKNVYAQEAGSAGNYKMILTVKDNRGGVLSTTTPIKISLPSIMISAQNSFYSLDSKENFDYSFSFSGDGFSSQPIYSTRGGKNTYSVIKLSGPFDLLASLSRNITTLASHDYQVNYSASIFPGAKLQQGAKFIYEIKVTDANNQTVSKDFSLIISPSSFKFNLNCPQTVRLLNPYTCQLNNGQGLSFSVRGLPAGLIFKDDKITGSPDQSGVFTITVNAQNKNGAISQNSFSLKVNTYCGDGIKENPNSEGSGGPANNGQESCDGSDGITSNPVKSNINLQYACQPGPGATTTYPILTNNQCVFKSPLDGGGYCGDGYCEARAANGQILETCDNCPQDCGRCVVDNTPRVMFWPGKVDQHWDIKDETWATDPDGSSGADVNYLAYCNKFYPGTSSVEPYKMETSDTWRDAGNVGGPYTATKQSYQCIGGSSSSNNQVSVKGTVTSYAYYGNPSKALANVKIVFKNTAGQDVATVSTNSSGEYQVKLAGSVNRPQTYTADASLSGYSDTIQKFSLTAPTTIDFLMSTPAYTSMNKIKLTWGASPLDLDSHLTFSTTTSSGTQFYHIWWPAEYHNEASSSLDFDVTQGYGPEDIRIKKLVANNYNFDVYNYSRCSNNTDDTFGAATVTVYNRQNGVMKVFHAQPNQTSCFWHVFTLNAQDQITPLNIYNNSGPQTNL